MADEKTLGEFATEQSKGTAGPIPDKEAIQSPGVAYSPEGRLQLTIPYDPNKSKDPLNQEHAGPAPAPGSIGEWAASQPKTKTLPAPMSGETHDAIATNGTYSGILNAFGQGFADEWGSAKFGPDLKKAMEDSGILYNGKGDPTVAKAFNEAFLRPAANGIDVALRTLTGIGRGLHDAAIEAGHPFDAVAAGMEAFPLAGGELGRLGWFPGKLAKPSLTGGTDNSLDLRVAKDLNVVGEPAEAPLAAAKPADAAKAAVKPIEAYHGSPYSFDAFSTENIGSGEGFQSYGHGLYFAEQPEVAASYHTRLTEGAMSTAARQIIKENGGDRVAAAKDQRGRADRLAKSNLDPENTKWASDLADLLESKTDLGAKYQVKLHVNKDVLLDHDAPANGPQQPDGLKTAYEKAGLDLTGATDGGDAYHQLALKLGSDRAASAALHEAGVPGIKYLDQGSRTPEPLIGGQPPTQLDKIVGKTYPKFWLGKETIDQAIAEAKETGRQVHVDALEQMKERGVEHPRTHNIVVFSDKDVEITHRNGEPVSQPVPAARVPDPIKTQELSPFEINPWQEHFDEWVGKLQVPEDVKTLIREASKQNGTFEEARAGQIPAAHLGALSDITGIPVEQLPEAKMRLTMKNDAEFRTAAQLMIKTNDDVFNAARDHQANGTFESRKELVASMMRRDLALEGVLGLRAEWGRTGNVMQEFLDSIKDAQGLGKFIKDKKGEKWDSAKLDEVAKELGSLNSREAAGRFLTDLRKPTFMDKAIYYWTNSILSGPVTHSKYVFANAAYIAHDTLIATPLAGVSGAIRQALSKDQIERVYMGETVAKVYGLVAGVPDALYAAGQAVKSGLPTALPSQMAGAGDTNPITGLRTAPIGGVTGKIIGAPSNVIAGIHSFYNFLGYRSELEAQAYRKAVKMGYSPVNRDFWQAQKDLSSFPDDPMMDASILAGQRSNFVQDLGPAGTAVQAMLYKTKIGRFIMPFIKVPGNIANAIQEGTPFAYLDERMRSDLNGKNGGAAKDTAMGRLAAGGAVMGWGAYETLAGNVTGNGPVDPKQRAEWLLTHQPHSIKVGGMWKSYDRFGPVGGWMALSSDITEATQALEAASHDKRMTAGDIDKANKDLAEATNRLVTGFASYVAEAGYQGLFDFVGEMKDPNRTQASSVGRTAGSFMPFSSGQSQVASFFDPYQRETKSLIDGVTVMIPGARQSLLVARDWSGSPVANPAYHSLLKNKEVNTDSVDLEMQRLDLKPTKPNDSIKGVKLTQEQYNEFQDHAGSITRMALHGLVDQPSWQTLPDYGKGQIIEKQIKASRAQAEAYMQMKYPALIQEGVDNKFQSINGMRHKPTAYERP